MKSKGRAGEADHLFQHLFQYIGSIHLLRNLGDESQVCGLCSLLGEEPGIGNDRCRLICQNRQPAKVLLCEVIGLAALGGYEPQRLVAADERNEQRGPWWRVALIGGLGRKFRHFFLEVADQDRLARIPNPADKTACLLQIGPDCAQVKTLGNRLRCSVDGPVTNFIEPICKKADLECPIVDHLPGLVGNQLAQSVHVELGRHQSPPGRNQRFQLGHALRQEAPRAATANEDHRKDGRYNQQPK